MTKNVKIGLAVVCLLAAGASWYRFSRSWEDAPPDTPESSTQWICRSCKADFKLTGLQYEKAKKEVGGKEMPLICPKCKQKDLWLAAYCPTHNLVYLSSWAPGSTGKCPKCYPDAEPLTSPTPKTNTAAAPTLEITAPGGRPRHKNL